MCMRPELPGHWDGEKAAGSEDFHRCFGIGAGSGLGVEVEDSSVDQVAGIAVGAVVEIVVHVAVSIAESVYSLSVVAVAGDYFESVDIAVFVCQAVAEMCSDMDSANCPGFGFVGSDSAYNVVVVYTESLSALNPVVGTIWYFVCIDPIPLTDEAAKIEKNYEPLESVLQGTDCKDMVEV